MDPKANHIDNEGYVFGFKASATFIPMSRSHLNKTNPIPLSTDFVRYLIKIM
jgi:hypothetical protein